MPSIRGIVMRFCDYITPLYYIGFGKAVFLVSPIIFLFPAFVSCVNELNVWPVCKSLYLLGFGKAVFKGCKKIFYFVVLEQVPLI